MGENNQQIRCSMIEVDRVTYYYKERAALQNISLDITPGQHIVILGANGSGKSTLAKHLNGLLTPASGDILVKQMNTRHSHHLWEIRKHVGMVFQNPENQIVGATVEDDIVFGMENIGILREKMQKRLAYVIEQLQIEHLRYKEPHQLSGGQKQRVAIAGILAMEPDVIIFDEATSMLDPEGRAEVLQAIDILLQDPTKTIIQITHDMEEALQADYVYVMTDGQVCLEGKPNDIFQKKYNIREIGLDYPFSMNFYHLLIGERVVQDRDIQVPMNLDELVQALCK